MRISDWSSDVCSSDLIVGGGRRADAGKRRIAGQRPALARRDAGDVEEFLRIEPEFLRKRERFARRDHRGAEEHVVAALRALPRTREIGRASCGERVCQYV